MRRWDINTQLLICIEFLGKQFDSRKIYDGNNQSLKDGESINSILKSIMVGVAIDTHYMLN